MTWAKFLDSLKIQSHKTKELNKSLQNFSFSSALFIYDDKDEFLNFKRASSNIPKMAVLSEKGLNVKDIISYDKIFIDKKSVEKISKRLAWKKLF